jgi:hypothetical protein
MFGTMQTPRLLHLSRTITGVLGRRLLLRGIVLVGLFPASAIAQRHYANLHAGGPVRVEDAVPEAAGEIELRIPALRLDDPDAGARRLRLDPAVSFTPSSRTVLELGASYAWLGSLADPRGGLTGWDVAISQSVALEGRRMPAVTVAVDAFFPAGALRSGGTWSQVRTMVTRSRGRMRTHLNASVGQYRVEIVDAGATCKASSLLVKLGLTCDGSSPPVLPGGPCASVGAPVPALIPRHCSSAELAFTSDTTILVTVARRPLSGTRWFGGLGVDLDVPQWSTLVVADVYASRLVGLQARADMGAELGVRRQAGSRLVLELGVGRRFAGAFPGWTATGGVAWSGG